MKFHKNVLLLVPIICLIGFWTQARAQDFNPGDAVSVSGKVLSFGSESITLEVGDPNTGTQEQTFPLPPAYTVVDESGNNVDLEVGMMVTIQGVIGDDYNPQFSQIVVISEGIG